jgi:hypothetical protein
MSASDTTGYQVFLLRIWRESGGKGEPVWCFVLVDSQTGKQYGFRSLDDACDYLKLLVHSLGTR